MQFGFMSMGGHDIVIQEDKMNTIHEMGNTIARMNAVVLAMQNENRMLRTLAGKDTLGVVGPRGMPEKVGFMGNKVNTMQPACECRSFTTGVGEGVGIGIGIGVAAAVTYGLLSWLKKV